MLLINKIKAINRIYLQLDNNINKFKNASELNCEFKCGVCCLKDDIESTILEFLPAAYSLLQSGKIEPVLEKLETNNNKICVFYNPFQDNGSCTIYPYRGLICRLFGYAYKNDKNNNPVLVTCKIIKTKINPPLLEKTIRKAPEMSTYYLKMYGIDPKLALQQLPINKAIKQAIEQVLFYYQFKKKKPA